MYRRRGSGLGLSIVAALATVVAAHGTSPSGAPQDPVTDPRCVWTPPQTSITRTVRNMGELRRRVAEAKPGTTILLEDGEYRLDRMLDITTDRVVIRGRSGDRDKVIVRGDGMQEPNVGVALSISASHVTLAHLTVGYVRFHGVQVRGERGASNLVMQNIRVVNTGQQLIKGSVGSDGQGPDDGLLACSRIEYTDHAPGDYTDGIDVLSGRGWIVRDNTFSRIRGPENRRAAGPAVLFWANSQNTIVERNLIVDSSRGIAFGLGPVNKTVRDGERYFDHQGGRIRNNVVWNLNSWGDEGIEANAARDLAIDHNTVLVEGQLPWSISIRFPLHERQSPEQPDQSGYHPPRRRPGRPAGQSHHSRSPVVRRCGSGRSASRRTDRSGRWSRRAAGRRRRRLRQEPARSKHARRGRIRASAERQPVTAGQSAHPTVSFVIPVRNDARRLERCLASIRRNTYPTELVETVVVDNGSTDDSVSVARAGGAVTLAAPAARVAELRNAGAKVARGQILAFVDADHEIEPTWIDAAVDTLGGERVQAAGAPYHAPPDGTWVQRMYDGLRLHQPGRRDVDWLGSGNLAVPAKTFHELGGFDVRLETCEDVDFCRRLRASGGRIVADDRMESTHFGDPETLRALWVAELWRGRDNLRVSARGPVSARDLPSILIPIVNLGLVAATIVGVAAAQVIGWRPAVLAASAFVLLAALRALRILAHRRSFAAAGLLQALAVAGTYDLARAAALVVRMPHRRHATTAVPRTAAR